MGTTIESIVYGIGGGAAERHSQRVQVLPVRGVNARTKTDRGEKCDHQGALKRTIEAQADIEGLEAPVGEREEKSAYDRSRDVVFVQKRDSFA